MGLLFNGVCPALSAVGIVEPKAAPVGGGALNFPIPAAAAWSDGLVVLPGPFGIGP